jgi:hypothetical protein
VDQAADPSAPSHSGDPTTVAVSASSGDAVVGSGSNAFEP